MPRHYIDKEQTKAYYAADSDILYLTFGRNRQTGRIEAIHRSSRTHLGVVTQLPLSNSIEGITRVGDDLLIANDHQFHNGGNKINELHTHHVFPEIQIVDEVHWFWHGSMPQSATDPLDMTPLAAPIFASSNGRGVWLNETGALQFRNTQGDDGTALDTFTFDSCHRSNHVRCLAPALRSCARPSDLEPRWYRARTSEYRRAGNVDPLL